MPQNALRHLGCMLVLLNSPATSANDSSTLMPNAADINLLIPTRALVTRRCGSLRRNTFVLVTCDYRAITSDVCRASNAVRLAVFRRDMVDSLADRCFPSILPILLARSFVISPRKASFHLGCLRSFRLGLTIQGYLWQSALWKHNRSRREIMDT